MSESKLSHKRPFQTYGLLVIVSSLLGVIYFVFVHYSQHGVIPSRHEGGRYIIASLTTILIGIAILNIDRLLDRFLYWQNAFLLRFVSGLGANIIAVILILSSIRALGVKIADEELLKLMILFIITIFIYEIFYGLFYSYRFYSVTQALQLQSERWQMELQFESLKSQISPHYLFNCLNTVSSLLYKDATIAEEFIRRMADTFRYVLTHQKQKLVTVREEIEFVKAYYFLLQVRYEYHLQMEINIPQSVLDTFIPPMTLQLLVENAVKHNAISKDEPLMVYISARDNTNLMVYNTKTRSIKPTTSFHVGLENIHKRYSFFTPEKVQVRNDEKFMVQLPVLKKGTEMEAA